MTTFNTTATISGGLDREMLANLQDGSRRFQRLERNAANVDRELGDIQRGARQAGRAVTRAGRDGARAMDRLDESVGRAGNALRGLRTIGAAAIGAGAVVGGIAAVRGELERLQQLQIDAPQLNLTQRRQLLAASEVVGIDEGAVADIGNEFAIRLGDSLRGEGSEAFNNAIAQLNLDADELNLQTPLERLETLQTALAGVADVDLRTSLADALAGGTGGQALNLLATDAEKAQRFFSALNREPIATDEQIKQADDARASMDRMAQSFTGVNAAILAEAAPALNALAGASETSARFIARLADKAGPAAPAIALIGAAAPAAVSGLQEFGVASLGVAQAAPLLAKGGQVIRGGFVAAASGIRAATLAGLAFIATPVGAIIAGVTVGVAALAGGIVFLADKFGGFSNLWGIAWQGIKTAALGALTAITTPLAFYIDGLNVLIDVLNRIPGIDIPNAPDIGGALRAATSESANETLRLAQQGLAEGRRQDEAGTSLGQQVGGWLPFGGGGGNTEVNNSDNRRQDITINVSGAGDPRAVADEVTTQFAELTR